MSENILSVGFNCCEETGHSSLSEHGNTCPLPPLSQHTPRVAITAASVARRLPSKRNTFWQFKKKKKKNLGLISQCRDSRIDFKWLQQNRLTCVNTLYFWLFVFMMMMVSRFSYPLEELFQTRDSSDLAAVVPKTFVFVDSTEECFHKVSVFIVFFHLYSLMEKDIHFNLEMGGGQLQGFINRSLTVYWQKKMFSSPPCLMRYKRLSSTALLFCNRSRQSISKFFLWLACKFLLLNLFPPPLYLQHKHALLQPDTRRATSK